MIRIFTAIELPEDIKNSLSSIRTKLKGAKWVNREQMHLTLRFIGEVSEFKLKEITESLNQVSCEPFSINLQGVGHFNSNVFWAGVRPCIDLSFLKEEVDKKLTQLGLTLENKKYFPHITIARLKGVSSQDLATLLEQFVLFESREFKVVGFKLFSSNLTPAGAIHSVESEFFF